jgi:hypothetical protein
VRAFSFSSLFLVVSTVVGCSQPINPPAIRSLSSSEKTSLVCRDMTHGEGRDVRACPDSEDAVKDDQEERHTLALVTQVIRGEVAVVDLHENEVIDQDIYVPGTEHLPVGNNPTSIVSTPGGVASFVGVAAPGREGIFALPTTCIAPPAEGEPAREVTLWSSCRLPSAPGEMVIAVDPTQESDADGNLQFRATCGTSKDKEWDAATELPILKRRSDCPANLEVEQLTGPKGRRKLVVTLPDDGKIAIFDAQTILNLTPGTFSNCVPERVIALSKNVPSDPISQMVPSDLLPAEGCTAAPPRYVATPVDAIREARPAGIALADSTLYVSDIGAPLIHVVDLSDPCNAKEVEPLRPLSYNEPARTVKTRDVAVSDLMPSGKRFVYALDDADGSAMVFDISPGTAANTPLVREHATEFPLEAPDRIAFTSPIKDLLLVKQDVPKATSGNETAEGGIACEPNPAKNNKPGALYRADSDLTEGAAPRKLRGLFGMLALESGQIAAIDIEDWDAPCRRPATNNPNAQTVDWLGCKQVSWSDKRSPFEIGVDTYSVTDESSCNVIEPHRLRSGRFFKTSTNYGANSANLVALPRLTGGVTDSSVTVSVDRDRVLPKMLGVPYEDSKGCDENKVTLPYTFVGTTKYFVASENDGPNCSTLENSLLETDPGNATQNSLLLPMREPRVYLSQEDFTATYEGTVIAVRENGWLKTIPTGEKVGGIGRSLAKDEILLEDGDARFCDQGVQDTEVARNIGKTDFSFTANSSPLESFAKNHSDFVVLMSDFDKDDLYFSDKGTTKACGDELRDNCESWFGTAEDPEPLRELVIREAYHRQLILTPRANATAGVNRNESEIEKTIQRIHCCFPGAHQYEVRAADQWVVKGARLWHDIVPGVGERCIKDCGPLSVPKKNRVFEISSSSSDCVDKGADVARPDCFIGPVRKPDGQDAVDEVCVVKTSKGGVKPNDPTLPSSCVFDFLKGRFAIYRGLQPSRRDMAFSWSVKSGFAGLSVSLTSTSTGTNVMPRNMIYSESLDSLVVVDGASGGINLFSLVPFAATRQPFL